jgi:hypothetical protein
VSRNNDEWTRHTRQMRRLLIMIVLLLGLLASAVARRIIEGRRTEPPRLKSSSAEELAPEEARPRGLIAARLRAGTKACSAPRLRPCEIVDASLLCPNN